MAVIPKLLMYIGGLTLLLFPPLSEYFTGLWGREMYQFFPIALVASLGLIASRHGSPLSRKGWLRFIECGLVVAGLGMLTVGIDVQSPWVCYVAFIALVAAGLMCFGDKDGAGSMLYLILPMLLTVRPPLQLDVKAVQKLQQITSAQASTVLDIMGIDHIRTGNVIEPLGQAPLMVEEACSGVQSMFTLLFLASMICVTNRYKFFRTIALLFLGVFWSGVMNTARVVCIVVARAWYDLDLAAGTPHELLGYGVLIVAALLLLSSDQLFYFVISPITVSVKHRIKNPFVSLWNRMTIVKTKDDQAFAAAGWHWLLTSSLVVTLLIVISSYAGFLGPGVDGGSSAELHGTVGQYSSRQVISLSRHIVEGVRA